MHLLYPLDVFYEEIMAIKLANNAVARIAATLGPTDTSLVLELSDIGGFTSLGAGEWHPITLINMGGSAHNNVQPSIVLAFIIKT